LSCVPGGPECAPMRLSIATCGQSLLCFAPAVVAFVTASGVLAPSRASADPVVFRFTGTVGAIPTADISWVGSVRLGAPFSGVLSFDAAAPVAGGQIDQGVRAFSTPLLRFSVAFPETAFTWPNGHGLAVETKDCPSALVTDCSLDPTGLGDFISFAPQSGGLRAVFLEFFSNGHDIVSFTDEIPNNSLTYMQFARRELFLSDLVSDEHGSVTFDPLVGSIDTWQVEINPQPVPEPGTLLLLTAGAGMALSRRLCPRGQSRH
jgi:hypothetical protein